MFYFVLDGVLLFVELVNLVLEPLAFSSRSLQKQLLKCIYLGHDLLVVFKVVALCILLIDLFLILFKLADVCKEVLLLTVIATLFVVSVVEMMTE